MGAEAACQLQDEVQLEFQSLAGTTFCCIVFVILHSASQNFIAASTGLGCQFVGTP